MDKRYQVFVSSTYADLKDERRAVIQAVMQLDCIPAGMELFPAADEQQLEFIKRVIDDCDYYLLIIGERYGSTMADGVSYTEKEYDYAVSRGLKVIALLHEDPNGTSSEEDPILREKLGKFKAKVSANRLVRSWKSADELSGLVLSNLAYATKTYPAVGWVRANRIASEDLLQEANNLRKQNEQLTARVAELNSVPLVENLAGLSEKFTLFGKYRSRFRSQYDPADRFWSAELTWAEIFASISPYLARFPSDDYVKLVLESAAFKQSKSDGDSEKLNDQIFRTVAVQLQALCLVKVTYAEAVGGGMGLFWSITPSGEGLMLELRTVKSASSGKPSS